MTKYGWRRVAEEQGWTVVVYPPQDGWYDGAIFKTGTYTGYLISGATSISECLRKLEMWWRRYENDTKH